MKLFQCLTLTSLLLLLSACYHPDINQGTNYDAKTLHSLKVGMTQTAVATLLGTPNIKAPFDQNEWIYLYYDYPNKGKTTLRHVRLIFKKGVLVNIEEMGQAPLNK